MKRMEMISNICLDTSCYPTLDYFNRGNYRITYCSAMGTPLQQLSQSSVLSIGTKSFLPRIIVMLCNPRVLVLLLF